jgi:hypothetical protein
LQKHRETLARAMSGKGAVTAAGVVPERREAELLADPNTPVEKLIEIRRRQQARG